jgi:hypothetical protein
MPDIYAAIAQNDEKITQSTEAITALSAAIQAHLTGSKGHVSSYKINDREIAFSVEGFQKEINRLKAELLQLRTEGNRLAHLLSVYEGNSSGLGRVYYRG